MPEQLTTTPETYQTMRAEPIDQLVERFRTTIPIVPATEATDTPTTINTYVVAERQPNGEYEWQSRFYPPWQPGEWVDPFAGEADRAIYDAAESQLRTNTEFMKSAADYSERWWAGRNVEELVDTKLHEVFTVSSGKKNLDILNCTGTDLTEEEQGIFQRVLQDVASFTDNKVFDRVTGFVLGDGSTMSEEAVAAYSNFDHIVRVNMDELRQHTKEKGLHYRYLQYFPQDTDITFREVTLAHELGHAMDITTIPEADANFINKDSYNWGGSGAATNSFSGFDDKFGWTHQKDPRPEGQMYGGTTSHRVDPAMEAETSEHAPTWYAYDGPGEDFAETFAIAALGGDVSSLHSRVKVVKETIATASGDTLDESPVVQIERRTSPDGVYRPDPKVDALALRVMVATS